MSTYPHFGTDAIHAGQDPDQWSSKAVVPPIVMSSTYKQRIPGQPDPYEYSRSANPTRGVFERCIAALEGAKHGIAAGSGLGATTLLCQLLKSGDHVIAMDDCYGGTYRFFTAIMSKYGIECDFIDLTDISLMEKTIKPNTKMIWAESLTNPTLKYTDIEAVVKLSKKNKDCIVVVDNTFMTPYFLRPLELGATIVYHSVTKYLNGHSDVMMGAVCTNDDELGSKLRYFANACGTVPSPFDCFLANRGMKTLHVRMREHQKNATAVAQFLETSPYVEKVIYPGLPSHPQHELMKKQAKGFSGMVTFYIKGNLQKFFDAVKVFTLAESLGGFESLVEHPWSMTHASIPKEKREAIGVLDTLVRVSVGLEETEDLVADLEQALKASQ
ncbi:putative cystathionine gamma-lyase 2 isoform X1 [Halichondria panicea]|uniref:putative cystathionine gamma-lyase 2 isoform X1 n=1 Tax=Halichondria panicea TaxID=6063 RepID=UPI00312B4EEE